MNPSPLRPPPEDGAAVIQNSHDQFATFATSSFASLTLTQVASGTLASVLQSPVEDDTHPLLHNPTNSSPTTLERAAWMDEVVAQSRVFSIDDGSPRLPVAHMVCNQMPPVGDKTNLVTFQEVETVFHEFGHALQHMVTKQDEGMVAGIRGIEWNAVELSSQFMENWCYHR
ncbi:zincin-like metalloproteases family protein [Actinidia rufa]|uniref:Zincin-like metalloproteases family protein n=1 Tax=Actinidia rufa TaxID=165716 RepID=A0A7J0H7Y6_9ERIC|nr:zincin-like metalloproteases family protein [Actinidia rufa]